MTQELFTIPERIAGPSWLLNRDEEENLEALQEVIAQDLIAIGFWKMVDSRTHQFALERAKKLEGWIRTLPVERQTPELQEQYAEIRAFEEEALIKLLGEDYYARARMMTDGADLAFDKATRMMQVMEQAQTSIALYINENGLLPYLELGSIGEYLLTKRSKWDGQGGRPGSWYETEFMVKYLIPTLDANGFNRRLVLGVADNFYKARFAIPYLRQIMDDIVKKTDEIKGAIATTTDEEELEYLDRALNEAMQLDPRLSEILEALVKEMVTPAAQGGMSQSDFREEMQRITGKKKDVIKAHGITYTMTKGGVLYIKTEDTSMFNAIQNMVSKLVDWHQGSTEEMAKDTIAFLKNQTK